MTTIFLNKEILKFKKGNKEKKLQLFELITYLAANKEISLDTAQNYVSILLKE